MLKYHFDCGCGGYFLVDVLRLLGGGVGIGVMGQGFGGCWAASAATLEFGFGDTPQFASVGCVEGNWDTAEPEHIYVMDLWTHWQDCSIIHYDVFKHLKTGSLTSFMVRMRRVLISGSWPRFGEAKR